MFMSDLNDNDVALAFGVLHSYCSGSNNPRDPTTEEVAKASALIWAQLVRVIAAIRGCTCDRRDRLPSMPVPNTTLTSPPAPLNDSYADGCTCYKQIDDTAQNAFIRLRHFLETAPHIPASPKKYLIALAKNQIIDELRMGKAVKRGAGAPHDEYSDEQHQDATASDLARQAAIDNELAKKSIQRSETKLTVDAANTILDRAVSSGSLHALSVDLFREYYEKYTTLGELSTKHGLSTTVIHERIHRVLRFLLARFNKH